ncbi:MAG: N-acetylmuramoyl-L-alanine amidase [Planctomycetota bacterium]
MYIRSLRAASLRVVPAIAGALSLFLAICGLIIGSGCAGPSPTRASAFEPPVSVSASTILAEPSATPELEIETLVRVRSVPAQLRRAFLELHCRRPQAAIDAAAEVLYSVQKPSANDEAFARYLRGEAYAQQGRHDRAQYDFERARALAMDSVLQSRVASSLTDSVASGGPAIANSASALSALGVPVQNRSAWSPRPIDRRNLEPMDNPSRVTIHHSAMYFRDTRPTVCSAQIQQIQREHMNNRGYGDIGYHFLIDPSGRIWEGRELRWQGAHASGQNNVRNIGICVLGNFLRGRGGQGPTPDQVRSMRSLVVQLMRRYHFGPDAIRVHSDFKATECPGPLMEPVVAQLVRDLQQPGASVAAVAAGH